MIHSDLFIGKNVRNREGAAKGLSGIAPINFGRRIMDTLYHGPGSGGHPLRTLFIFCVTLIVSTVIVSVLFTEEMKFFSSHDQVLDQMLTGRVQMERSYSPHHQSGSANYDYVSPHIPLMPLIFP
jgi:hypothetical protein